MPRTKPLLPLFELISNSVHSIDEAERCQLLNKDEGEVIIECIRNGAPETLQKLEDVDMYPIHTFIVSDNGIGLNDINLKAFIEADTDHKIEIGGKGVGRFICLKAFRELNIESYFLEGDQRKSIQFDFKTTREGFHDLSTPSLNGVIHGTTIKLNRIKDEYQKTLPSGLMAIAREIVTHFQLYFIREAVPKIIIRNQNNNQIDLKNLFNREFKPDVESGEFQIGDDSFELYLTKSSEYQSHKIHFCAHNRSVLMEGLYSKLVDLGRKPIDDGVNKFFYQAHVISKLLDDNVDTERIGFNFPDGDDDEESDIDINLSKIRKES
ncbi:MAG TPA: hypothetical protein VHA52_11520, partial [Candidatus Babeliaceae bacterium]|nr:hypothetical protein [Candidatus Babeliaceae bacterium]